MNRRLSIKNTEAPVGSIEGGAERYAGLKREERELESQRKEVGSVLLQRMLDEGRVKQKVDLDDELATVQVKTRTKMSIDEDRLKKALGATAFNKLTSPVLDETKLEAAIQLGDVDVNVVASCTEETETPYLECRFKAKK